MLESNMRRTVIRLLKPLHARAIETGLTCPGFPDVDCAQGEIELKATNQWPARLDTKVKLDHDLSPQQRAFLIMRRRAGGKCWVLVTVDRDWLLYEGGFAAAHLGDLTKQQMLESAIAHWVGTPPREELIECLSRPLI